MPLVLGVAMDITEQLNNLWIELSKDNFTSIPIDELEVLLIRIREVRKNAINKVHVKQCILIEYFIMAEQNFRVHGDFFIAS